MALTLGAACAGEPPSEPSPEHTLEAEGVTLEQMGGGRVVWRATVARAFGDLGTTELREIVLRAPGPAGAEGPEVRLRAPRARVERETGTIELVEVEVDDGRGGKLLAPAATYDEKTQIVTVRGPVRVSAPTLQARAAGAAIDLAAGSVDLAGPVRGRWEGAAAVR